jgi:hypothetical protein
LHLGTVVYVVGGSKMCVQTTHGYEVEVGSWLCGFSVYIDSLMVVSVSLFAINISKYLSP